MLKFPSFSPHPLWKDFSYSLKGFTGFSTFFSSTDYYYEIYPILSILREKDRRFFL